MLGIFAESHLRIRYLLLLLLFIPFVGCKSPNIPRSKTSGVGGRYDVTAYIVAKDTLYFQRPTSTGYFERINKIGVGGFTVDIDRIDVNQVRITTFYFRNKAEPKQVKEATFSEGIYEYKISLQNDSLATGYDGKVLRVPETFYQRQTTGGLYIPVTLTGTPVVQTTSQEVIIIAQKQRW